MAVSNFLTSIIPGPLANIPSTLNSGITSAANSANSTLTGIINDFPAVPQYYFTVPFPNNQLVLYKLEIVNNAGSISSSTDQFIFPLSPSSVTKQTINLTNYYDVAGGASSQYGVQRIVDQYGLTPPIITISGTTGFQFHSLDGFQWSGKSSFARLVQIVRAYVAQVNNIVNSAQNQSFPTLNFYDGYTGDVYQVVPWGPQSYNMDASRPILQTYNLQFLVTVDNGGPQPAVNDPVAEALVLTKGLLTSGFLTYWNAIIDSLPTGNIS